MNDRARILCEALKNSFIWGRVNAAFQEEGKGLTEKDIELYVYVIDARGPRDLAGISRQYSVLEELAHNNFSHYAETYDNLEAYLKKLLYVIDPEQYRAYESAHDRGIAKILKCLGLMGEDFHDPGIPKAKRYGIFSKIILRRNQSSHSAPVLSLEAMGEAVWESVFVELWAVRTHRDMLEQQKSRLSGEECERIVEMYRQCQIRAYEERLEKGFQYIQIEYEKTGNPEDSSEDRAEDVAANVIRGTADTLWESIHFEETPGVKLVAEAGMGKTMMLEYLNYKLSKELKKTDDSAGAHSNVLPFLIYCNDAKGDLYNYKFEDTVFHKLRLFLDANGCGHVSEKALYDHILEHYKVMFLLDGLNEIKKNSMDKSRFIKSLLDYMQRDSNKRCYFLITERYSKGAVTIRQNVVYYRLSEITDEIKKEFFRSKGTEVLFERLEAIKANYDPDTQQELNLLLKRPFYLSVFCELADSFSKLEDARMPKTRKELMDFFVEMLIRREGEKGEIAADYRNLRLYFVKLGELLFLLNATDSRLKYTEVLKGLEEVTAEYGLDSREYASNHILELFEQLGLIRSSGNQWISVEEIYAEYMCELWCEDAE